MNSNFDFNRNYGLKLSDRLDGTYYSLLILSITFFALLIIIFTQMDYGSMNLEADEIIRDKYKQFAAQFTFETPPEPTIEPIARSEEITEEPAFLSTRARMEQEAEQEVERMLGKGQGNATAGEGIVLTDNLPDVDDYVKNLNALEDNQLSYNVKYWPTKQGNRRPRSVNNLSKVDPDKALENPFNYVLNRRGNMYIKLTDEIVDEPVQKTGYRDPTEIERIVEQNQHMIEYCFRKEARRNNNLKGYVQVEFRISYEGFVIPESIRIMNSTVRSKKVETCIKNYIKRWRNFSKLDENMGIARVVQKFVFN